jgi:hypothetical protein
MFRGFEKYRDSSQTPKGLAFGFTKKLLFTTKTCQKFVFRPLEAHILSQFDVLMSYINLGGFKNIEFRLKTERGYLSVLSKNIYSRQKLIGNLYFLGVSVFFCLS